MIDSFIQSLPNGRGAKRLLSYTEPDFRTPTRATLAFWALFSLTNGYGELRHKTPKALLAALHLTQHSVTTQGLNPLFVMGHNNVGALLFRDHSMLPLLFIPNGIRLCPYPLTLVHYSPNMEDGKAYTLDILTRKKDRPFLRASHKGSMISPTLFGQHQTETLDTSHPVLHALRENLGRLQPFLENRTRVLPPEAKLEDFDIKPECALPNTWPKFLPWRVLSEDDANAYIQQHAPDIAKWLALASPLEVQTITLKSTGSSTVDNDMVAILEGPDMNAYLSFQGILIKYAVTDTVRTILETLLNTQKGFAYTIERGHRFVQRPSHVLPVNITLANDNSAHQSLDLIQKFGHPLNMS